MITFEEYENALKQRHGERIHNILSHSSVAIAGLGGLGSNIAMYLARAGVGHLHLVDFDKVDITNLNRQQYDIADLGTLKTDALTKNIKRFSVNSLYILSFKYNNTDTKKAIVRNAPHNK